MVVTLGFMLLSLHLDHGLYFDPLTFVRPLFYLALLLLPILFTWGRYKRSARVKPYEETLHGLLDSDEEFCLILRPFGSDGEVVLPYRWRGALTMEQVIARAARKFRGLRTYAIVDQDRRLAPPGPVYLRAPHDRWQTVVQALVRRAHSIVLILPPGQDIRSSFSWEIDQLTQHGLQSRTTIVLPPDRLYRADHPVAFHHACVLLAALEGFAGSVDEASSLRVHELELTLSQRTHVIKYCRATGWDEPVLLWWHAEKRRTAWVKFYLQALVAAFVTTESELADLGFTARYPPWPSS